MRIIAFVIGIVLLLPGLCTLDAIFSQILMLIMNGFSRFIQEWPFLLLQAVVWVICLGISYLGLRLLRRSLGKI